MSPYRSLLLEQQHRRNLGESEGEYVPGNNATEESSEQADYSRDQSTNKGQNFRNHRSKRCAIILISACSYQEKIALYVLKKLKDREDGAAPPRDAQDCREGRNYGLRDVVSTKPEQAIQEKCTLMISERIERMIEIPRVPVPVPDKPTSAATAASRSFTSSSTICVSVSFVAVLAVKPPGGV